MNWFKRTKIQDTLKNIKDTLLTHPFTIKLRENYDISENDLEKNLILKVKELDGQFAKGNGKEIVLDPKLFKNDNEFLEKNFHFVVHEFFHWLKRRYESDFYFNDSEEVQSFVLAITWEIINKKNKKEIKEKIFPIIKQHFKNEKKALQTFNNMYEQALNVFKTYYKEK